MNKTFDVTFTGVDRETIIDWLPVGCEYGILLTEEPRGRQRYVEYDLLPKLVEDLAKFGHRSSLHFCGNRVRERLMAGEFDEQLKLVQRLQINGQVKLDFLEACCLRFPQHDVITQHTPRNAKLVSAPLSNHQLLVDGSGGRGVAPKTWERPPTKKLVGFAGGLGPHSVESQLPHIRRAAGRERFWIDMETRLRDRYDWFSIAAVKRVLGKLAKVPGSLVDQHFGKHWS